MSSATDSRDVLKAALEAKGIDVSDDASGQWSAPVLLIEAGEPWIERFAAGGGSALVHWRLVSIAALGSDAKAIAEDLLATALPAFRVVQGMSGWNAGDVSGVKPVPEKLGNYVAVEQTTTTSIDITEGA